ncbi:MULTISPECIES: ribbon-helix-helix protein, CopG family [Streptococcus]|uniref:ribbon-helix-helix protein, CopG family n=1 Tax=Streptococcus TaxID=1301 RepID=UPI00085C2066|nr:MULTISPECIES: ribbon-helix-helix protein, CopG family [Streptococcus]MCB2835921.1 ribbon-helix-helix protein, CopG family [Streptococcus dysgalactiae subsp. dysgalactiae]MCB2839977.1 ribbon-helix-helix protein, CopG family [Streptococcus dysgalactiae subsp. dysgalactiae]MCB2849401.1 ribbon-helix-helix protein, CopG family [Streptococcus dysgalactiae subsp. dysgalactiae]
MTDKRKVGRPPKGEQSNNIKITVRISEQLDNKVAEYAERHGLSKPETIRKALEDLSDQ